ncbi:molybdopterin-synthase adenylyltransferase MoeB [Mucilaginibacter limnophilus]|uniref:Molybdopterin-synthase adenylyltransferase n=1 Tax=Mucilaginibacter limnophilus TaxID=1932778 RepID=A0A437MSL7_9SPHI|nr:HesA/MoeB/ThiF family protein [Mucilaginibacter limnophilus]RVU00649.1 molybdopterin-synthase adenylyltransferase MoeB [Mucilaginibacter limnophilus]
MNRELLRYSCQIALPGFGEEAQQRLQQSKVLIVGAGGLGCPAAQYLAAAGIGTLGIADFDAVSVSNLHRQVLYGTEEVGKPKARIACEKLQMQNPGIILVPHQERITHENVMDITATYDIIIDCSDNFETRYLLNDAAVLSRKPLVYGAIYQYEGQVAVWNISVKDGISPNYRDLFPNVNASQIPDCATGGVIPTLAGIIGCMQANEAIKYITQTGEVLAGKVLLFDAQTMQSRVVRIGPVTKTNITSLPTAITEINVISAEELKEQLQRGDVQLIDVRTQQERDAYHIGGEHIPLQELERYLSDLDPQKITVFYCASGKRSAQAARMFKGTYPNAEVFSLEGGAQAF